MPRPRHARVLIVLLLTAGLGCLYPAADTLAQGKGRGGDKGGGHNNEQRNDRARQEQPRLSPGEAAARARARHGGRVLKVTPQGSGYRVKLLQDNGRVMSVTVRD